MLGAGPSEVCRGLREENEILRKENKELRNALKLVTDSLEHYVFQAAKESWATDDVADDYAKSLVKPYRNLLAKGE